MEVVGIPQKSFFVLGSLTFGRPGKSNPTPGNITGHKNNETQYWGNQIFKTKTFLKPGSEVFRDTLPSYMLSCSGRIDLCRIKLLPIFFSTRIHWSCDGHDDAPIIFLSIQLAIFSIWKKGSCILLLQLVPPYFVWKT